MMTFDTGAFSNACKPGAKPREKIEDDEPVVDSNTEKVNRAERLSKEKENRRLRQAKAKEDRKRQTMRKKQQEKRTDGGPQTLGKGLRGTSDKKVPRGKVRVNPVTGALETITQDNDDPNYVREGCMRIHKKYMNAAVEAGRRHIQLLQVCSEGATPPRWRLFVGNAIPRASGLAKTRSS